MPLGPPDTSGISVVVLAGGGAVACLADLARQSVDPELVEVLVVGSVPADFPGDIAGFGRLRVIQADASVALGAAAARRAYVTFVDSRDHVSENFVADLLAVAGPASVALAEIDGGPVDDWSGKCAPTAAVREALAAVPATADPIVSWAAYRVRHDPVFVQSRATYYRTVRSQVEVIADFTAAVEGPLSVIADLEAVCATAPAARVPMVDSAIAEQTDLVGSYVRARPEEFARVVEALDRTPAFRIPYERINTAPADALAIAYAFPPYADTSAVVAAKRIRADGEVFDLVANAMGAIRHEDPGTARISGPFIARRAYLPTPSYFTAWGPMEVFARAGSAVIDEWLSDREPYRRMYSRAHFAASHVLATLVKLRYPDTVWRAEFSDPLSRDVHGRERGTPVNPDGIARTIAKGLRAGGHRVPGLHNAFRWCEEVAYALADEVVFTNENQLDYMLGYCADRALADEVRRKAVVWPQPVLPPAFYAMADSAYALEPGRIHLAYFGGFYANRGIDDVLRAMAALGDELSDRLRLHVFTQHKSVVESRAAHLGVAKCVCVSEYVPFLEFLALATRFDCLIVADAATAATHERNPYLPSKWADYVGSGTPVWALVEAGSTMSGLAPAHRSSLGDVAEAAGILRSVLTVGKKSD